MPNRSETQGLLAADDLPWRPFSWRCGLAVLVFFLSALGVRGQVETPLHIAAVDSIVDEFGAVLDGDAFRLPGQADLVQVLRAPDGVLYPPSVEGLPDPRNPVLGETWIGHLAAPSEARPGKFGIALNEDRPADGTHLFVRVFNAACLRDASFYGDSQRFTVKGNDVFDARIAATAAPLDPRDDDGDGLSNSLEKSLASDPHSADSDGDGMLDADEFYAGTDLLEAESVLSVEDIGPAGPGELRVRWLAVPGVSYQVQRCAPEAGRMNAYADVGAAVVAEAEWAEAVVPDGSAAAAFALYRVVAKPGRAW